MPNIPKWWEIYNDYNKLQYAFSNAPVAVFALCVFTVIVPFKYQIWALYIAFLQDTVNARCLGEKMFHSKIISDQSWKLRTLFLTSNIYQRAFNKCIFFLSCNTYLAQVKISEDYQKCIVQIVQTTDYVLFNLLKCDITEFVFERTRSWGQACREITREKKLNVLSPLSHKLLHERYCLLQCICKTHFCNKIF